MPSWSPEAWNSFGVVGIVVCMGAVLFLSLIRGWIVLGTYHREIVEGKDAALAEHRERAAVDAETMRDQARVIAGKTGVEDINIKLLQAIREVQEGDRL
ncbi:hypothetical protein NIIDNTM18_42020 [Mycolicibacterium litorale]|uniref:Uncharacterized protein n=1 Tax=Mycolicibacterium litorale TaxID=758802 RepID=A0A6S6P8E2_9MYCO|nr:hypothetical protein [Mycolicibacterium litorale]BCI54924.1 hypothetical protein NIIDNTM18_42020 [Mycolicibacterium litorale]